MSDSCADLQAQIAELRAAVAAIPKYNQGDLLALIEQKIKELTPGIATFVCLGLINPVKLTAEAAAVTAKSAFSLAGIAKASADFLAPLRALTPYVGAILALLQLAAEIGTLLVLGQRIDALEREVNSLNTDLSRVLGLLNGVKQIALQALSVAQQAQSLANNAISLAGQAFAQIKSLQDVINFLAGRVNTHANQIATLDGEWREVQGDLSQITSRVGGLEVNLQRAEVKAEDAQNSADTAIAEATQALSTANTAQGTATTAIAKADQATSTATQASSKADIAKNTADKAQGTATEANKKADKAIAGVNDLSGKYVELKNQVGTLRVDVNLLQKEVPPLIADVLGLQYTYPILASGIQNVAAKLVQQDGKIAGLELEIRQVKNGISTTVVNLSPGQLKTLNDRIDKTGADAKSEVNKIVNDVTTGKIKLPDSTNINSPKYTSDINNLKSQIGDLDNRLGDQEKLNRDGLTQLENLVPKIDRISTGFDNILPTIAGIPIIAGAVNDLPRKLPNINDITNATGTAICKSLNGGCSGNANKAMQDNIVDSLGNKFNNAANAFNAGANAAQLGLLNTINGKLGDQLPGGIGGKLQKFIEWSRLGQVMNILTFAATVHNAFQLSTSIGQTLGSILGNVLQVIGIKNEEGQAIDVSSVINSSIENLIRGIVGAENYTQMSQSFAKANRIYQASTNVLNSFMSLSQIILQANEMIASHTGKIGNALKKGGVVLESAYGWMNPQPKFNRVTNFLESLGNTASTVQMVTQVPVDAINAVTALNQSATELTNAIKNDGVEGNKATAIPEPDTLKANEVTSKTNSRPPNFSVNDLFDGDD